ncbi:hypothetical protein CEXT_62021 [Caerostris extrusa]|uniref:Ribosomal protein L32 n=1 Tax=Caerostris extrusa TaxID=172846 RepID=A0AAV4R8K2_CAEEX|nr:hypothetical protein CEXT_62021 [Caerostris extrusa]
MPESRLAASLDACSCLEKLTSSFAIFIVFCFLAFLRSTAIKRRRKQSGVVINKRLQKRMLIPRYKKRRKYSFYPKSKACSNVEKRAGMVLSEICRAGATHQSNIAAVIILEDIPFPGENKVPQSARQNLFCQQFFRRVPYRLERGISGRNARIPFSWLPRRLQLS